MHFRNLIFVLFTIPFILNAQTKDFSWLVGKWKTESAKGEKYEEWQLDGRRLKGEGYTVKDGQKQIFETLYLENFGGKWAYIALPKKQIITLFALTNKHNNVYTFENYEHDFPQRIVYRYDGDKTIHVSVEADQNNATKNFELIFSKIE